MKIRPIKSSELHFSSSKICTATSYLSNTMSSRNPTGFDMKEFKAAANPRSVWAKKDPWARHEAWRYTGPFSRWNRLKGLFPGLGTATVLFAGYLAYEQMFLSKDHEHGHENDETHH